MEKLEIEATTIVRSKKDAQRVLKVLSSLKNHHHAWDTESMDLEVKEESPVGKGKVICFSGYCGADVDFGNGPKLFVDNFGECADLINEFKPYFEDENFKKVWFNYSFDKHMLSNHGIQVR